MMKLLRVIAITIGTLAAVGVTLGFFAVIPIEGTTLAMDWQGLWAGIKDGVIQYGNATGLRIPPWSIVALLPLGFLSFRLSWGLLALVTLAILIISVPDAPKEKRIIAIFALATSYPALRTIADGNLEALVIAGALLLLYGFHNDSPAAIAAGILLIATKIQESWILLLFLPIFMFAQLKKQQIARVILVVAAIGAVSMLWKGREWIEAVLAIEQRGSIMDSSLWTTASRWNVSLPAAALAGIALFGVTAAIGVQNRKRLSNELLGFFIAASLLLAPYAAGNSYLTPLALGVIPLLLSAPIPGLTLILLANAPYLVIHQRELLYWWSAPYWTLLLFLTWAILGFICCKASSSRAETQPCSSGDAAATAGRG